MANYKYNLTEQQQNALKTLLGIYNYNVEYTSYKKVMFRKQGRKNRFAELRFSSFEGFYISTVSTWIKTAEDAIIYALEMTELHAIMSGIELILKESDQHET